jgi:predicted acetyltransferase
MSVVEGSTRKLPEVSLEDAWSSPRAREFFLNVWPMYVHELSAFDSDFYSLSPSGRWLPEIAEDWVFERTPLGNLRGESSPKDGEQPYQRAHVIREDGRAVGFACIGLSPFRYMPPETDVILAEFFLVHRSRGRGVGASAFGVLNARYPGRWSLSAIHDNARAVQFWRKTLPLLGISNLRERVVERERVWDFIVRA